LRPWPIVTRPTPRVAASVKARVSGMRIAMSPLTRQYSAKAPSSSSTALTPWVKPATRSPRLKVLVTDGPMDTTVPAKSQPTVAPAVGMRLICFQSVGFWWGVSHGW